jgi:DNA polymerase-3 subunit epsilon
MLTLQRPLVVVDLEATGTDPSEARIIQVAACRLEPGAGPDGRPDGGEAVVGGKLSRLVNPGVPIPGAVTELTGIAEADVADAPSFAEVAGVLGPLIGDADLAGFNVHAYDLPLLEAEYERIGRSVPGPDDREVLDVLRLEHTLVPRSLEALYRRYTGEVLDGAHDAETDVAGTLAVLRAQLKQHEPEATTPAGLCALVRGDYLDDGRKLKRRPDGSVEVCFGKHQGRTLTEIYKEAPGYVRWMYREITELRPHLEEALG